MEVQLYRHAATQGNTEKKYIGKTDEPICEKGIIAAKALGCDESVKSVYTSGLMRTMQTAKLMFPNAELVKILQLNEMDFGDFDGMAYSDLLASADYQSWLDSQCEDKCPNGESKSEFMARVCEGFEEIVKTSSEEKLIIVAHAGTIMSIMCQYARPQRPYFDWYCGHCEGFSLNPKTGEWGVLKELPR